MVSMEGVESVKNGRCAKPLSKPRGWCKKCKTRGQKKSPKMWCFEKSVKKWYFSTFSTFLRPGTKCQKRPVKEAAFSEEMTKMQ